MADSNEYRLQKSLKPEVIKVLFQLERLRRNYQTCIQTYDTIALWELSHTLRMWSDLKSTLPKIAPAFGTTRAFKSSKPSKKLMSAVKGRKFVIAYMPGGVTTHAHRGELISSPNIEPHIPFTLGWINEFNFDGSVTISSYWYAESALDDSQFESLKRQDVEKYNYASWMGAEAVRLWFPDAAGESRTLMISREVLINRIANTLDGSHPSIVPDPRNGKDKSDPAITHLLEYKLGGLPLPYFILLKIAQDILDNAGKLLGIPKPQLPTITP